MIPRIVCSVGSLLPVPRPWFWSGGEAFLSRLCVRKIFQSPINCGRIPISLFRRETTDGFCFRGQPIHSTVMRMNAEPVFLNGIELMLAGLRTAASSIEVLPGQRVIVVPHQPSGKLLKALVAAAKGRVPGIRIPEQPEDLREYDFVVCSDDPVASAAGA
jgi:hypothetical protein